MCFVLRVLGKLPLGGTTSADRGDVSPPSGFDCAEVLLASFTGQEASRILDAFFQNITKCDVDIRKNVCASVALSGDTAMVKGIGERMTTELTASAQSTMEIEVFAPAEQTLCMGMDLEGKTPRIRPHSYWKCF